MSKVLKAAGSGLEHVVKANLYMREMDRDFGPMNEIYVEVRLLLLQLLTFKYHYTPCSSSGIVLGCLEQLLMTCGSSLRKTRCLHEAV